LATNRSATTARLWLRITVNVAPVNWRARWASGQGSKALHKTKRVWQRLRSEWGTLDADASDPATSIPSIFTGERSSGSICELRFVPATHPDAAVLVRPVDLWTRRYGTEFLPLSARVALPTTPQAQHQIEWPDLNRNRWPVVSESAGRFDPFAAPSANGRNLRTAAVHGVVFARHHSPLCDARITFAENPLADEGLGVMGLD
jgi:hypothetical protein